MADNQPTLDPFPHEVRIGAGDVTLAISRDALLLRHGFAPDIYVPLKDVQTDCLTPSENTRATPDGAVYNILFHINDGTMRIEDAAWQREESDHHDTLRDHVTFDFEKVSTFVDGTLVRGHVRDPRKVITVAPVAGRLQLMTGDAVVVDSTAALQLFETGLPARHYVPRADVDAAHLLPSDRQTVCTYKGEATYYHLRARYGIVENAVWCYADAWTDFAADLESIRGRLGLYASAFDAVLLDGEPVERRAADAAADSAMIARPTIDRTLRHRTSAD